MELPLLLTTLVIIASQSLEILHIPRKEALEGEPITIEVALTQPLLFRKGELKWRVKEGISGDRYEGVPMVREGDYFVSRIPSSEIVKGDSDQRIEYYIWMVSTTGEVLTLPVEDPEHHPFEIEILPSWLEILTPLPGESVEEEMPEIACLFTRPVHREEIEVFLDEKPTEVEITEDYFLILFKDPLSPGTHNVKVMKKGTGERSWSFFVLSKPDPVRKDLYGSLSPAFQLGSQTGRENLSLPYPEGPFLLMDGYGGGYYKDISFYGWVSRDPTYGDPFRFGGELKVEGDRFSEESLQLAFGFGDLYPSFSRFSLYGLSPIGFETSLNYGAFGLDLVTLRTHKADSLLLQFDQYLLGAKATFSPFESSTMKALRNFILTTTVLSGWDDSTSRVGNLSKYPEKNRIYALGFQMDLTEDLLIRGEVARSHLDQQGETGDPLKDKAYEMEASYEGLPVGIGIQYEETGKDYLTFGNPYLEAGRKGPSFHVGWEAPQLSMRGGYGHFLSNGSTEPAWNRFNGRVQYALKDHNDLYLLLNWTEKDPLYNSKSVTGGFISRLPPFTIKGSHSEIWTDYTIETRTRTENGGVEWKALEDRMTTLLEIQSYHSRSTNGLINQARNTPRVVVAFKPTPRDEIEIQGSWIDQEDGVVPSYSFTQQVVRMIYTRRF